MSKPARICFLIVSLVATCSFAADADVRRDFLKLIDRPRVDLAPRVEPAQMTDGAEQFQFSYASEEAQRVPGIILKPTSATGRSPVVITLHGTGGTKEQMLPMMRQLVAKGFIAIAIDGRYHGHRTKAGKGSAEYQEQIVRAWQESGPTTKPIHEHPLYFDTVWDVMRLVDYLQTRDDVDARRIGLIGISKGGIETYLTAAVDERIAVAVPCIGVQSFDWEIEHDAWQSRVGTIQKAFDGAVADAKVEHADKAFVRGFFDRVTPGIAGEFDGPTMLPLIAPRPLMTINGDSDARTPMPGLKLCTDAAAAAYHAAGADDRFVVRIEEKTGHKVNPDAQTEAIEWLTRWLIQPR
jgi:dienelactone hydrolase